MKYTSKKNKKMEDYLKKMEDDLKNKIKWKTTSKKIKKMEDDLKHNLKKSTLIGYDIIVN